MATGTPDEVSRHTESLTGRFLRGRDAMPSVRTRRDVGGNPSLELTGARLNNLQNVAVNVPLQALTCVTGVSGSGKSSLIMETLVPALRRALGETAPVPGPFETLRGADQIDHVVEIDQTPIGRTGRSNPATYSGIWDEIRRVFARTKEARLRGYTARRFSFNAAEGRCAGCRGQGTHRIEMHFMPDMHVTCPTCRGARFNRQTLAIRYAGRSVEDVLRMRIDEAVGFFENFPRLRALLETLNNVGLGYLTLGQSSLTLSGGEAQRVKLATELSRTTAARTLFVLDEPTTGLHPADIVHLLALFEQLVGRGHSVLVIEHQLDVMAAADWLIDVGPEGGRGGGAIVAAGPPEEVAHGGSGFTAQALASHLRR